MARPSSGRLGIGLELDAVADVARQTGLELIPTTYLWGGVGPIVADEVYETVREKIVAGARENAGRIDGVMLVLHGAMATVSIDDAWVVQPPDHVRVREERDTRQAAVA